MKYLDRYLQDVRYNLYGKDKNDIIKELKADILNRLDENYSEDDLKAVLEELGSPTEVARVYNFGVDGLTITGSNFNNYIKLVQLMFFIGLITSFTLVCINNFTNSISIDLISFLAIIFEFARTTFMITIYSIGILTIIFYFIERQDNKNIQQGIEKGLKTEWSIKDLKSKRYSLADYVGSTIVVIFWSVIFLVFLDREIWQEEFRFFHHEYFTTFAFLIFIGIFFEIIVNSYRYFIGEQKFMYVALNIFQNAFVIFSSAYILIYKKMFYIPQAITDIDDNIFTIIFIINVIIAISSIVMSITRYIKLR